MLRRFAKLAHVKRRSTVSGEAESRHLADVALAGNFDELLATARATELRYRHAQATAAPVSEQYPLAKELDADLTAAMRAAYAAQRAEIGPLGYDDRIYRRKAMARPAVHRWTDEAERLLTMRETYRLTGFPARLEVDALGVRVARIPAA
ncbi:MAG TPA: hypothetical protein DEH11_08875 [Actinobacteria bacterium]|jgi:hypothetical protein|nr:hypothetical protein [Actinomycetota bacterium]